MVIRNISYNRAEQILTTLNPKYKWFYVYDEKNQKLAFYSETKFLYYIVNFKDQILKPETRISTISYILSLIKDNSNFMPAE